ncbi:MAG: cation:proton antiporter [Terriglobales bacterium]
MEQFNLINVIAVSVAVAVAAGIPALVPRLPVPGVVLEIVIGAIIGPQVLGIVPLGVVLDFLALFGLWMLFLMAGFEMDPAVLRGRPLRNALAGWALTAFIAFGAAMLLSAAGVVRAPILTALALSTTAIGALLPVLRDAGLLGPPYGPMVLAAGAMGEAGPVMALSLVLAGWHAPEEALIMLAFAAGAVGAVVAAARASGGHFARIVERTMGTSGQFPLRLALCLLFLLVVLSEKLEIDLVLGAFVAGAVVRAALQRHHHEAFSARLDGIGSAFLVPIYFVTAGTRLDIAALVSDPVVLMMVPAYALLMLAARGVPALLLYRSDLSSNQRIALALHCGTQLPLVVAFTSIAVQRGLMPGGQGAALVGGAILTMLLFPALARCFLRERTQHESG